METCKNLEMTLAMLEELSDLFDAQNTQIDTSSSSSMSGYMGLDTGYQSLIRIGGAPILPPVMTDARKEEMQQYKRQAVIAETRLKSRRREKLLAKVQSIVDEIETRRTPSPSQGDQSSSEESQTLNDVKESTATGQIKGENHTVISGSYASSGSSVSELNRTVIETASLLKNTPKVDDSTVGPEKGTVLDQTLDSTGDTLEVASPKSADSVKDASATSGHQDSGFVTAPSTDCTDSQLPNSETIGSQLPNSETSDSQLPNSEMTGSQSPQSVNKNKSQMLNSGIASTGLPGEILADMMGRVALSPPENEERKFVDQKTPEKANEVPCGSDGTKTSPDQPHSNNSPRTESVCDSEAVSYMGEYCPLPTPAPIDPLIANQNADDQILQTPDVSVIPYIHLSERNSGVGSSQVDRPCPPIVQSSLGSSVSRTDQLLSQKSILPPESLVSTAGNTASTDLQKYMQGSLDTITSSLTLKDETADGGNRAQKASSDGKGSGQLIISPGCNADENSVTPGRGHVRKNSYTLDQPSPALLMAHAQMKKNEETPDTDIESQNTSAVSNTAKPKVVQRKLNYEEEIETPRDSLDRNSYSSKKERQDSEAEGKREHLQKYLAQISAQPMVPLPTEQFLLSNTSQPKENASFMFSTSSMSGLSMGSEDLLKQQANQFEQLRQQLVEQQRSQLASLLLQQQQEQMILQKELVEKEQKFQDAKKQLLRQQGRQIDRVNAELWLNQVQQQNQYLQQQEPNSRNVSLYGHMNALNDSDDLALEHVLSVNRSGGQYQHAGGQGQHLGGQGQHPGGQGQHLGGQGQHAGGQGQHPGGQGQHLGGQGQHLGGQGQHPGGQGQYAGGQGQHAGGQIHSGRPQFTGQWHQGSRSSKTSSPSWKGSPYTASPHDRNVDKRDMVALSPTMHKKFCRLSAAVKGYLTRRLYKTEKIQAIIQTIKDTTDLAISIQTESPSKKMAFANQDKNLQDRVIAQLRAALLEINDIFFVMPNWEKMQIIAQDRQVERDRQAKQNKNEQNKKRLSAATQKAMERKKKAQIAESAVFGHSIRPKSAPETSSPKIAKTDLSGPLRRQYQSLFSKVLKPAHGNLSPIKLVSDKENRLKGSLGEPDGKTNAFSVTGQKSARRNLQSALATPKRKTTVKSTGKQKNNNVSKAAWR